MPTIGKLIHGFRADTRGTTAIEYATIASIIALALVVALPGFSASVGALFSTVASAF